MHLGSVCFSTLFLKFHWGDDKCRQIFFSSLWYFIFNICSFLRFFPQICKIIKYKSTKGISILSVQFILMFSSLSIGSYISYKSLYDLGILFDSIISMICCLTIIFYHTHIIHEYSLSYRFLWYFSMFHPIWYLFSNYSSTFPEILQSQMWFIWIFVQLMVPIPQIFLLIWNGCTNNFSCLPYLYRAFTSLTKFYNTYYYSKENSHLIFSMASCILHFILVFLTIILPKEQPKCCVLLNSPVPWDDIENNVKNLESCQTIFKNTCSFISFPKIRLPKRIKRMFNTRQYQKLQ